MSDFSADGLTKLLQYGPPGFAAIMLIMGYQPLKQLITLGGDDRKFKLKLFAVISYMLMSLVLFIGGVIGQYWLKQQNYPVSLLVTPSVMPNGVEFPTIRKGINEIELKKGGAVINVKSDDQITLQIEKLTDKIVYYQQLIPQVQNINSTLGRN